MQIIYIFRKYIPKTVIFLLFVQLLQAQPITGIWKGKMGNYKVELKLVRKGDSLIGTSYYYDSKSHFIRYSVKGYFDDKNNDVIWWDDVLIEDNHAQHFLGTAQQPLLAVADFNCPGEGIMKLDGNTSRKDDESKEKKQLHLVKGNTIPVFPDEWDFLIENYVYGVNHPEVVDSIEQYAFHPVPQDETSGVVNAERPSANDQLPTGSAQPSSVIGHPSSNPQPPTVIAAAPPVQQSNEERYAGRKKILQQVIPVKGDSIELRFYDNAEIDGDSIAVFLNGHLLQEHILLAEQAYIMKIAIKDLQSDNELVMVAENLGSIPPNTSLMVALVDDKRYEAHLQSTEGSSALVRLVKPD
jgi:hypothetical protein